MKEKLRLLNDFRPFFYQIFILLNEVKNIFDPKCYKFIVTHFSSQIFENFKIVEVSKISM